MKNISIVIPIYNEEKTLDELWRRLSPVTKNGDYEYEILFVDDGSKDNSLAILKNISQEHKHVKLISLSRNFGHQAALSAGIDHATGEAVVLMDGDLQDRPEAIVDLAAKWQEGYDIVYVIRGQRKEMFLYRFAFKLFYRVMHMMSGVEMPLDSGIFSIMDRKAIDVLKKMPERNRYITGLRAYTGFKQTGIKVDREKRFSGATRVGVSGLIKLALDGLVAFSYAPLRLIIFLGFGTAFVGMTYILIVLYKKYVSHQAILGWSSILVAILFLGGLQLITLGIIGEYIGRIYEEVKQRPYYVIGEKVNFDERDV